MPSATTSGADATPNGNAKSRDHNQGNQDRKYTIEQKTAVVRVRRCAPTAFYEILGLEKSVSDGEIKKAYRKLSLLTHPDKNGYEGADEAFKSGFFKAAFPMRLLLARRRSPQRMKDRAKLLLGHIILMLWIAVVSRAFQILSDPDKKSKFDKFGGDPDNRFGPGSAASQSPFSGFSRTPGSARQGPMWEEEISPEEMFNRFFGGGMGGGFGGPFGGGMFDTGPGFVFNLGGGPGFRVHQMGGGRPRRRPPGAHGPTSDQPAPSLSTTLSNLLPLLILFVLPLLSSLFSSSTTSTGPSMRFDTPKPPLTLHRQTPRLKVSYYLNPTEVEDFSTRKLSQLDQKAEENYVRKLQIECEIEVDRRNRLMQEAQGWFFQDADKMDEARTMEMRNCRRLDDLRMGRSPR
ncbi:MAG: hypothetical protein M1835_005131 [Candelina submexicana]|nr:MAG: hypothetical protein M1835_005131 [Candelina submexicana]